MCRDQNVKTNYRQNKNKKFVHIWDMSGTFLLPVKIGSSDINDKWRARKGRHWELGILW